MDNPLIGLRALRDISDVDLARLSGVSRSTLNRIERGTVQPTLRSLREIAIAAGLDVEVSYRHLSDPAAARAARHILDDTFTAAPMSDDDRDWVARLSRIAGDNPVAIVETAGIAASLLHRRGAIGITEPLTPLRLASAGDAAGGSWAISGASALNLIAEGSDVIPGPEVLYVDDVERAWRLLDAPPRSLPDGAAVILAPYGDEHSIDVWMSGPLQLVAPVQLLLDGVGLSGDIAELALTTAGSW
jgi:transcriptional regulator with XRE-family HTH domain